MWVKKILIIMVFILMLLPINVSGRRGCCSHHGGVAGCNSNGRQICNDGTLSPTCTCTPSYVYGCTDSKAYNYNARANKNDGSCKYYVYGCTDKKAYNYNSKANKNDGSCKYYIYGCTDREAYNYSSKANKDDGSCKYYIYGCTDINAINYDSSADKDDGSCEYNKANKDDIKIDDENNDNESDDSSGLVPIGIIALAGGGYAYKKRKKNN